MKPTVIFFTLLALCGWSSPGFASPEIKTKVQTVWNGEDARPVKGQSNRGQRTADPIVKEQKASMVVPKAVGSAKSSRKKSKKLDPYWVQIGAFSSEGNASRLAASLKRKGYKSQVHLTKSLDHKVLHLVLIGDFSSKQKALDLAEAYSLKLNERAVVIRDGAIIRVFNPLAPLVLKDKIPRVYAKPGEKDPLLVEPPDSIFTPSTQPAAKYSFSVGGLYQSAAAKRLARKLRKKGYQPRLTKKQDSHQIDWWYSVEIGNFFTKTEAESAATIFFEREHLPTEVNSP